MKIIVVGILLVISLVGHETNAKSVANTLVIEYKEKFEKHYYWILNFRPTKSVRMLPISVMN